MVLENVVNCINDSLVIKKGSYDYVVNPLMDGVPAINPICLNEITDVIMDRVDLSCIDYLIGAESMAIPFLTALSMRSGVPFLIIRKRSYGLEGEVVVDQSTGYSKGALYINSLPAYSNVLVLDDVISTGGTLSAILRGLFMCNVNVKQIVTVVDKCNGGNIVSNEFNIPLLSLVDMDIVDGVVVCSSNV